MAFWRILGVRSEAGGILSFFLAKPIEFVSLSNYTPAPSNDASLLRDCPTTLLIFRLILNNVTLLR